MTEEAEKLLNYWTNKKVIQWKKESDFKFWNNLTPFQRKVLTKDIKAHFVQMFELGRQSLLNDISKIK